MSVDTDTSESYGEREAPMVIFYEVIHATLETLVVSFAVNMVTQSFSAITTRTSFNDHILLSLFTGGLSIALSELATR